MDEKKYSQLYQALLQEVLQFHNGNQRRIRKGMLSLLLVPLAFLVLLFLSEGSRVIFLLLWIVSMFGIAAYLIAVEYIDYEMQNKVKRITKKEVELDQLTPLPSAMPQLLPLLRGPGQESEAVPAEECCRPFQRACPQRLRSRRMSRPCRPPVRPRPGTGIVPRGDSVGGAGTVTAAEPVPAACFVPRIWSRRPCPDKNLPQADVPVLSQTAGPRGFGPGATSVPGAGPHLPVYGGSEERSKEERK